MLIVVVALLLALAFVFGFRLGASMATLDSDIATALAGPPIADSAEVDIPPIAY